MSDQTTTPQFGDPAYADLVRRDFDRLASFETGDDWNHNNHYHAFLLSYLPRRFSTALDVGCGAGSFARRLAVRADHVLGVDLSPAMLELARERSSDYSNITYQAANIMADADIMTSADLAPNSFDCIASIATLHHLPLVDALARLRDLLRPGGMLLVLDLYENATLTDYLTTAAAVPAHWWLDRQKNAGRITPPDAAASAAWDEHGSHDVYPTLAEVRQACAAILPQAQVRRHLLWRYSLVWTKIGAGD